MDHGLAKVILNPYLPFQRLIKTVLISFDMYTTRTNKISIPSPKNFLNGTPVWNTHSHKLSGLENLLQENADLKCLFDITDKTKLFEIKKKKNY